MKKKNAKLKLIQWLLKWNLKLPSRLRNLKLLYTTIFEILRGVEIELKTPFKTNRKERDKLSGL